MPAAAQAPSLDFVSLYREEVDYVWRSLRRLGVDTRDLEDLTHDVFVVVHRRLADFDAGRRIRPWLFGIALRVASDHRRSARRTREVLRDEIESADEGMPADVAVASVQRQQCVRDALLELDLDRRAVFVMHELEGHTMPEIAEALSIPLNTAYSRLRLARVGFVAAVRAAASKRGEP